MKTGRGSSLYEVLKNASRNPGEGAAPAEAAAAPPAEEAAAATTLQERLAAYKAAKLAAAQTPTPAPEPVAATVTLPASAAVAVEAPPAPVPKTIVLTPDPTPPPRAPEPPVIREKAPAPVPAPVAVETTKLAGPGERVLKLTYNTAAFAVLVVVGVVFIAYALGLRTGRASSATETVAARPVAAPPAPVAAPPSPPAPKREFTLRLAEWKYGTSQERLKANAAADELKQALEKAGHRPVEKAVVKRGEELKLALYLGAFTDLQSESTRNKLATIRAFKVKTATPFSQAAFEEAPSK
jgi:2-oxoglutarate dehydrogenase E2 component (dihydrolipoamide succinyltransferase)